ncbi:hypothetical protein EJ110_NYTH16780 [Nymphaea thermarum]|nr:hypothetical protein EJ110_NYTH16780 [Nymphaea thermarum]
MTAMELLPPFSELTTTPAIIVPPPLPNSPLSLSLFGTEPPSFLVDGEIEGGRDPERYDSRIGIDLMEAWLVKVSSTLKTVVLKNRQLLSGGPTVGVLAFEMAGVMSKLLQLWHSLADKQIARLRHDVINQEGVRKVVSNDDSLLIGLACAEIVDALRLAARSVSRLASRSTDPGLLKFDRLFHGFANSGSGDVGAPQGWVLPHKEMESKVKKASRYVTQTARLYKEMEALAELESAVRKLQAAGGNCNEKKAMDLRERIEWSKQEVRFLKDASLWSRNYDSVVELLARLVFTIVSRLKVVFRHGDPVPAPVFPRSSSVSAVVHPASSDPASAITNYHFASGPLRPTMSPAMQEEPAESSGGLFDTCSKLLEPPPSTLGAAALALHYANVIIIIEKMAKTPHLIGSDARDDLYGMLPASVRASLRTRLRSCRSSLEAGGFCAADPALAEEWSEAIRRILDWLSPLAHNMIRWQSERNFEQRRLVSSTNALLLQTLFFANQAKTEAAITELLVGLNYIWRYERELNAKAFLDCNSAMASM